VRGRRRLRCRVFEAGKAMKVFRIFAMLIGLASLLSLLWNWRNDILNEEVARAHLPAVLEELNRLPLPDRCRVVNSSSLIKSGVAHVGISCDGTATEN
jgi:hypothetical protein